MKEIDEILESLTELKEVQYRLFNKINEIITQLETFDKAEYNFMEDEILQGHE